MRGLYKAALLCIPLALAACSKQDRVARYTRQSDALEEKAEASLIAGDFKSADKWAESSLYYAKRAQLLPVNHPFAKQAKDQLEEAKTLDGIFDDPACSVRLWWEAIGENKTDLALALFDVDKTVKTTVPGGDKPLADAFTKSLMMLYDQYLTTVSSMKLDVKVAKSEGNEAVDDCSIKMPDGRIQGGNFSLYLHHDKGAWLLYDMSTQFYTGNNTRVTEAMADYIRNISLEALLDKFEGKGLMDVFSSLDKLRETSQFFQADKGLIKHYVTFDSDLTMRRNGKDVTIKEGSYLVVISVGKIKGEDSVVISTTEAEENRRAYGEALKSSAQDKGNDEDNLWFTAVK